MRNLFLFLIPVVLISCGSGNGETRKNFQHASTADTQIKTGIEIGQRAPELVFKSPSGENLSLSSLRGKMVLIDFWASWCSPCRRENPNLVKTYKRFMDKSFENGEGFSIYGVSLDKDRNAWINAIKSDGLVWEHNVSDLKGTASEPAAIYGIMAIPANLLIDGDGIIVAKNLRGEMLAEKLNALKK